MISELTSAYGLILSLLNLFSLAHSFGNVFLSVFFKLTFVKHLNQHFNFPLSKWSKALIFPTSALLEHLI